MPHGNDTAFGPQEGFSIPEGVNDPSVETFPIPKVSDTEALPPYVAHPDDFASTRGTGGYGPYADGTIPNILSTPILDTDPQDNIFMNERGSDKLLWSSWKDYPKVMINDREYAKIGHRYYPQHAVDRMQPSSLGAPAGSIGAGRNITPNIVEEVIKSGTVETSVVGDICREVYTKGNVSVVTENNSEIIVTVLRNSS